MDVYAVKDLLMKKVMMRVEQQLPKIQPILVANESNQNGKRRSVKKTITKQYKNYQSSINTILEEK